LHIYIYNSITGRKKEDIKENKNNINLYDNIKKTSNELDSHVRNNKFRFDSKKERDWEWTKDKIKKLDYIKKEDACIFKIIIIDENNDYNNDITQKNKKETYYYGTVKIGANGNHTENKEKTKQFHHNDNNIIYDSVNEKIKKNYRECYKYNYYQGNNKNNESNNNQDNNNNNSEIDFPGQWT